MKIKTNSYHITLDNFAGPFELLLELIEKNDLEVTRIALSKIADEYLGYIEEHQPDLGAITNFLEIASKLALIKSLTLLPSSQVLPAEEEEAADFEEKVRVYSAFRQASQLIAKSYLKMPGYSRKSDIKRRIGNQEGMKVDIGKCQEAFLVIVQRLPKPLKLREERVKTIFRIRDLIEKIKERLKTVRSASFFELSAKKDKREIAAMFLAFLELAKSGGVTVCQEKAFDDILIKDSE